MSVVERKSHGTKNERLVKNMCKKSTVAYGDFIGQRMVGWCVFNGKDFSFLSDKQIKTRLQNNEQVNGLTLDADGNVIIDQEFTKSLMGKSGLTFKPIVPADNEDEEPVMNKYYALVKVSKDKDGTKYHFITNRCGMETFDEVQLKAMLEVMDMGGVRKDEKGALVIHKAVDVESATTDQNKPKEAPKGKKEEVG